MSTFADIILFLLHTGIIVLFLTVELTSSVLCQFITEL